MFKLDSVLEHIPDDDSHLSDSELDGPSLDADANPPESATPSLLANSQQSGLNLKPSGLGQSGTGSNQKSRGDVANSEVSAQALDREPAHSQTSNPGSQTPEVRSFQALTLGSVYLESSDTTESGSSETRASESLEAWEGKDGLLLAALQAFCGMFGRWRVSVEPFPSESVRKTVPGGPIPKQDAPPARDDPVMLTESSKTSMGGSDCGRDWWAHYSSGTALAEPLCAVLCGGLRKQLERVCGSDGFSPGARCWAARALTEMGGYGCPSRLGGEVGAVLGSADDSDVVFKFSDGQSVGAHRAILAARCPVLLAMPSESTAEQVSDSQSTAVEASPQDSAPPEHSAERNGFPAETEASAERNGTPADSEASAERNGTLAESESPPGPRVVQLSNRVSYKAFTLLLEYVYSGWLALEGPAKGEVKRELLVLAKKCQLEGLVGLLERRRPLPGDRAPGYSLAGALRTAVGLAQW